MIKNLNGIKETVDFDKLPTFLLYNNDETEEYPTHWHAPIEIIMPLENSYTVSCGPDSHLLEENDIIIIPPGVAHKCHACSGRRIIFQAALSKFPIFADFNIKFNELWPAMVISNTSYPDIHDQCSSLMSEIMDEYFSEDPAKEYIIASNFLKLMGLAFYELESQSKVASVVSTKQKINGEIFDKIRDYTIKHCTENITLDEIAERSGFSKYYFSRAFKDYSGISYYKYLTVCRINHSTELLMDPNANITEIAISSGFNSISSFIRMFKQVKGCTPTDYRKMHEMPLYH